MCSCDLGVRNEEPRGDFLWGGCSHDVRFGERFSREFIDDNENTLKEEGLMNVWNNEAGRKVTRALRTAVCWFYNLYSAV